KRLELWQAQQWILFVCRVLYVFMVCNRRIPSVTYWRSRYPDLDPSRVGTGRDLSLQFTLPPTHVARRLQPSSTDRTCPSPCRSVATRTSCRAASAPGRLRPMH